MDYDFYEDDEVLDSAVTIIEYFRNNFVVIKDFLNQLKGCPWDNAFMMKNNISEDELVFTKKKVISSLISYYHYYLLQQIDEGNFSSNRAKTVEELNYLFFTDEEYMIKIFKAYIKFLKEQYDVLIDTKNYFMLNIENIREILISEHELMDINNANVESDFEKKYDAFSNDLHKCIKGYIDCKINKEDNEYFIKYLFSLAYAYVKNKEELSGEIDDTELKFMEMVESDIDYVDMFDNDSSCVAFILECIDSSYIENIDNYDLRHSIEDSQSKELFSYLDDNFNNKFDKDILINDITLESKLEKIMKFFKNQKLLPDIGVCEAFSNDSIKELLDGVYSIYEPLVAVGLDGRYQELYRELIIRKFVADVYEFLGYECSLKGHSTDDDLFLSDMNEINLDCNSIFVFFEENYSFLMDYWYLYQSKSNNYKIDACIDAKEKGRNKKIFSFNVFSMYRYLFLALRKVKHLKSVDLMNEIIEQLNSDKMVLSSFDNQDSICKIICLNVYERLIIQEDLNVEYREIVNILNNELNLTDYLSSHQSQFLNIIKLFKRINNEKISYDNECVLRKSITDDYHVKVLKRLNPYNE